MLLLCVLLPGLLASDQILLTNRNGILISVDRYETSNLEIIERAHDKPAQLQAVLAEGNELMLRVSSLAGWSPSLLGPKSPSRLQAWFLKQARSDPGKAAAILYSNENNNVTNLPLLSQVLAMMPHVRSVPDLVLQQVFSTFKSLKQSGDCLLILLNDGVLLPRLATMNGMTLEAYATDFVRRMAEPIEGERSLYPNAQEVYLQLLINQGENPRAFISQLESLLQANALLRGWLDSHLPTLGLQAKEGSQQDAIVEALSQAGFLTQYSALEAKVRLQVLSGAAPWATSPIPEYWKLEDGDYLQALRSALDYQLEHGLDLTDSHWDKLMVKEAKFQELREFNYLIHLTNHQVPSEDQLRALRHIRDLGGVCRGLQAHEQWLVSQQSRFMMEVYVSMCPSRGLHLLRLDPAAPGFGNSFAVPLDPEVAVETVVTQPSLSLRIAHKLAKSSPAYLPLLQIRHALMGPVEQVDQLRFGSEPSPLAMDGLDFTSLVLQALTHTQVFMPLSILEGLPTVITYPDSMCQAISFEWGANLRKARPVFLHRLTEQLRRGCQNAGV